MLTKVKRKDCLEKYSCFPTANNYRNVFFHPEVAHRYVVTVGSKTIRGHRTVLINEIILFLKAQGSSKLVFLGDTTMPWLKQANDYRPAKEALQFLKDNKIGKTFNGGIEVGVDAVPVFLKHLYWISRCNAAFPLVHFIDQHQKFLGHICQYGFFHLDIIDDEDERIAAFMSRSHFLSIGKERCYNQFSVTSAIKRRQTIA